jgi:Flagellar protein FliT
MSRILYDLEILLDESLRMLVAPDCDMDRLRAWGRRREALFARLQDQDAELPGPERAAAAGLIEEILRVDATVIARLKRELTVLEQKITAANKIQRALVCDRESHSPVLLRRIA